MQRFFIDKKVDNFFIAHNQVAFQMVKVLRYKPGQKIEVVYKKEPFLCEIDKISTQEVQVKILSQITETREPSIVVDLYISLLKKDKFEMAIQKATELGVSNIIPVITSRTIIKIAQKSIDKKISRWKSILKEASEQCRRTIIPYIASPININQISQQNDLSLVCYEDEKHSNDIKKVLKNFQGEKISLFIGPEGGISLEEIQKLKEKGFKSISLGKRILRAETATIFAISTIIYERELKD